MIRNSDLDKAQAKMLRKRAHQHAKGNNRYIIIKWIRKGTAQD